MSLRIRRFIWWPRKLYLTKDDGDGKYFQHIGWVWWQRVTLFRNISLGYIAILEHLNDQVKCPHCKQAIPSDSSVGGY